MALQHTDFNDFLPPLAARGTTVIRNHQTPASESRLVNISGRYLDPVSRRLDQLSVDEYYRKPVPTYLKGRADFIYHGQQEGFFSKLIPDIFKSEKVVVEEKVENGANRWIEYKIWSPEIMHKESCYTNLPATF